MKKAIVIFHVTGFRPMSGIVHWCCEISILFAFLLFPFSANAGKLDDIGDAVGDDYSGDEDDVTFCLFCFMGNEQDDDASYERDSGPGTELDSAFLRYPYADGADGYAIVLKKQYDMVADPRTGAFEKKYTSERTTPTNLTLNDGRNAAFLARAGYWYNLDNVHLSDIRIAVDGASMAGVQFRWTEFYQIADEQLDTTGIIDLMLRIPLVTEHRGLFRLGVAGLLMHQSDDTDFGGFLAGEIRLFPFQPMILGADLHIGYISQAVFIRTETTLGIILGPMELYGGYQAQLFLRENNPILSHGPGGGLRLWF